MSRSHLAGASGIRFLLADYTKIESKIAKSLCNISSQNPLTFGTPYGIIYLSVRDGRCPRTKCRYPLNAKSKVEPPRTRAAGGVWQPAFLTPRAVAKRAIPDRTRTNRPQYIKEADRLARYRKPRNFFYFFLKNP